MAWLVISIIFIMTENKDNIKKKKKTLSLKLGTKPLITPKRNIEAGKTVIVEKKRYKRSPNSEAQFQKTAPNELNPKESTISESGQSNIRENKSGVLLKPLSKDQQKRILKADSKKEKKDEIEKIRLGNKSNDLVEESRPKFKETDIKIDTLEHKDYKKEPDKKKISLMNQENEEKKKNQNTFGRKKIRERKVTIVTALSDIDERTRSLAAYKRAKQKTKKNQSEQEPAKKIVRDVYKDVIPHGRFPLCVLNIGVPLAAVDVNIHPQKLHHQIL